MPEWPPRKDLAFAFTPVQRLCGSCQGKGDCYLPASQTHNFPGEQSSTEGCPVTQGPTLSIGRVTEITVWNCRVSTRKSTFCKVRRTMWNVDTCGPVTSETDAAQKTLCELKQQQSVSWLWENTVADVQYIAMKTAPGFSTLPHPEVFLQYFSDNTRLFHHASQLSVSKAARLLNKKWFWVKRFWKR